MATINVYLTFNGNCEEAFNFYKKVFGGEFSYLGRFSEMPPQGDKPVSKADANKIMHVSLPISKETVLMGSDASEDFGGKAIVGNNFSISLDTDSRSDADSFFKKLSQGGRTTMPMSDTFWGSYFGMLTDQFGINWMVSYSERTAETSKKEKTASAQA
jgi:PhnB protein